MDGWSGNQGLVKVENGQKSTHPKNKQSHSILALNHSKTFLENKKDFYFKFSWLGGLEIRGCSNWRTKKKSHSILAIKYSKTFLDNKKDFYMLFSMSMSFLRQVHKYIFQKYNCTERHAHLLIPIVRIGGWVHGWVGQNKSEH